MRQHLEQKYNNICRCSKTSEYDITNKVVFTTALSWN